MLILQMHFFELALPQLVRATARWLVPHLCLTAAELSSPGSVLIAHNSTEELLDRAAAALGKGSKRGATGDGLSQSYLSIFQPPLLATWLSGFPADPTPVFEAAGWQLERTTTRARIAADLCADLGVTGSGVAELCAFDVQPDAGEDRYAVFCIASRL